MRIELLYKQGCPRNNYITQVYKDIVVQAYAELGKELLIIKRHDQITSTPILTDDDYDSMIINHGDGGDEDDNDYDDDDAVGGSGAGGE